MASRKRREVNEARKENTKLARRREGGRKGNIWKEESKEFVKKKHVERGE